MFLMLTALFSVLVFLQQVHTGSCATPHVEVSALHDLFNSTCGNSCWIWRNETEYGSKWNFSQSPDGSYLYNPCIDWQGIMCNNAQGNPCNATLQPAEPCNIVNINLFEYNLTGSVPSSLGFSVSRLQELTLWRNLISSSIPSSLGLLTELVLLDFDETGVEGQIPSELAKLQNLGNFYAAANRLTGTLPPELGSLSALRVLFLYENGLGGPLPDEFGSLTNLEDLIIHTNHLTGTIPFGIGSNLNRMRAMFLQGNAFSGKLDSNFFKDSDIETLDITNNQLTGQLPEGLFQARNLNTLALSINCFTGSLPSSMCSMQKARVIALDGLGASTSCSNIIRFPVTKIKLFNTLEGTIPDCVWSLQNLTLFHIAGNGLTGTLPQIPSTTHMQNLSIAHNKLSGTIPSSLQTADFIELDLSYNKLTGEYNHDDHGHDEEHHEEEEDGDESSSLVVSTRMNLQVNRLSGSLSETAYTLLRILDGNLFGCEYIPDEDENSDTYACGSILLDEAMSSVLIVGFMTTIVVSFVLLITCNEVVDNRLVRKLNTFVTNQAYYFKYLLDAEDVGSDATISKIRIFGEEMLQMAKFSVLFFVAILLFTAPIYIMKLLGIGESHTFQYRWFYNLVYVRGELIAVMMMIAWIGLIGFLFFIYYKCDMRRLQAKHGEAVKKQSLRAVSVDDLFDQSEKRFDYKLYLQYFVLGSLNLFIVVLVNGSYIYSTYQELQQTTTLFIQMALAIFKMAYALMVVPILTRNITDQTSNIAVRSMLNLFNNLFLPCVATAFTSPTCYQGLIQEPHEVYSSYTYSYCYVPIVVNDTSACLESIIKEVDIAALIPPFNYNYQCGSVVLTSYIPVFIYGYAFQLTMPFFFLSLTMIKYDYLPGWLKPNVHGVLWPEYWLFDRAVASDSSDEIVKWKKNGKRRMPSNIALPERIIKVKFISSQDLLYHVANLCTFGICSPFLAAVITICLIMKLLTWIMVLGRFLSVRASMAQNDGHDDESGDDSDGLQMKSFASEGGGGGGNRNSSHTISQKIAVDNAVAALSEGCVSFLKVFDVTIWPIIWSSCLFFATLAFDIAADEVGAVRALWIPLVCLSVPPCMKVFLSYRRSAMKRLIHNDLSATVAEVEEDDESATVNPINQR